MKSEKATKFNPSVQFKGNFVSNLVYYIVNVIAGILIVPFFVDMLGVESYGIIPLATSISGYIGIMVHSLNASVGRFITIDIQSNDISSACKTFSISIITTSIVIGLLLPLSFIIAWIIPSFFNIPAGQEEGAFYLFLGVFIGFILRAWSANYTVQIFAMNRLDIINIVNLVNLVMQYALIISLFVLFEPSFLIVGIANVVGALAATALSILMARKICPGIRYQRGSFQVKKVVELSKMGWWVAVNRIGSILFLQVDLLVVNKMFGTRLGGEYAIALQWAILIRSFAAMLAGVMTPTVLAYYTRNEINRMAGVLLSSIKLMGFAMAFPVGLICGLAPVLLEIWLGCEYTHLYVLIIVLTFHLCYNMSILPLNDIFLAHNKMRVPGIMTVLLGLLNLAIAVILGGIPALGYIGIALAGALVLTSKNAIFSPWYASRILRISAFKIVKPAMQGLVACVLVMLSSKLIYRYVSLSPLAILTFVIVTVFPLYVTLIYRKHLSIAEQTIIHMFFKRNDSKYKRSVL